MNAMDLMIGLNNVRDKFVVSAGEFRQGERQVRALPKRKLWLIAAVIALALLLVGCAVVYVLRMTRTAKPFPWRAMSQSHCFPGREPIWKRSKNG